ncbi:CobW family GTP-binding protein [sulfur-oxidizing endosymbiont of Gigantopelta aegis]|uniref:CobW family GTP-binding protein n=1 Tax=sulfur-oxidizing endosymbiont of Gigantopelta aegis TaxID=2794934 RepID=UPI0018DC74E5|nr:CobW family GTP-binding protein [sulfur-oxidizing endosymbiont of Gigantopelta aegis]
MSKKIQAIPTNLITGFLGSGKTTAILSLLRSRPENSNWAVLVNEFGDVGIDGDMFAQDGLGEGVFIKEVPGGCLCCAAGLPLQIALNLLIKQANPERILIEPTGVGHPKKVMDVLTGEFYKSVLDIRATICLVEAHKLNDSKYRNNETFIDQINMADVILASKSDQASSKDLDFFKQFFQNFEPAKAKVETIEFGQFNSDYLNIERKLLRSATYPNAHAPVAEKNQSLDTDDSHSHDVPVVDDNAQAEFKWQRFENNGQGYYGCGWIFDRSMVFSKTKLIEFVNDDAFSRVKGIFHTEDGWILLNRSDEQLSQQTSTHRDDSRVELIEAQAHDWNKVEAAILACIQPKKIILE